MRVISGIYRSRILEEVDTTSTRETKDRVKESIFNSIQTFIPEAKVLDLFAGSGSLGIEAKSRGASEVVFVDNQEKALKVIRKNVLNLHIEHEVEIFPGDYETYLNKTYQPFDVILLDPPYSMDILDDIIKTIARKKLLHKEGVIVCLYGKSNTLKKENNGIIEYKKKTSGITNMSYYRWGE